jgi:hypothetical protein
MKITLPSLNSRLRVAGLLFIAVTTWLVLAGPKSKGESMVAAVVEAGITATVLSIPPDPTYTPAYDYSMSPDLPAGCSGATNIDQPGTEIAVGSNAQPTQRYGLRSYQVEVVVLPAPVTCLVQVRSSAATSSGFPMEEQTRTFDRFWRLRVTGDRVDFPITEGWYIWLDTQVVGYSPSGSELVSFIYDRALLKEGATVGVSYGLASPLETLTQPLHLTPAP